jgi:hypothetical protein
VPVVAVEKHKVLRSSVCVCVGTRSRECSCALGPFTNPARNALPFCHLRPPWLHKISLTLSNKGHDLRKQVTEYKMCIFIFSKTFICNRSHYKNSARYCHKCENVFM